MTQTPVTPIAAATILLLRDAPQGLTAFMVRRNRQVDFASNALVFPGGKHMASDAGLRAAGLLTGDAHLPDQDADLCATGLREAFEEAGILCARRGGVPLGEHDVRSLDAHRAGLDRGKIGLDIFLTEHGLQLDMTGMCRFAHWITPVMVPKRFDTHFFICPAPETQHSAIDGREAVEGVWMTPADVIEHARTGAYAVMFPTRMVMHRLAQFATVADAVAGAPQLPVVTCVPELDYRDGEPILRIPVEAGYPEHWEPYNTMVRGVVGGHPPLASRDQA